MPFVQVLVLIIWDFYTAISCYLLLNISILYQYVCNKLILAGLCGTNCKYF